MYFLTCQLLIYSLNLSPPPPHWLSCPECLIVTWNILPWSENKCTDAQTNKNSNSRDQHSNILVMLRCKCHVRGIFTVFLSSTRITMVYTMQCHRWESSDRQWDVFTSTRGIPQGSILMAALLCIFMFMVLESGQFISSFFFMLLHLLLPTPCVFSSPFYLLPYPSSSCLLSFTLCF